jgi:hypothetical protein
MSKHRISHYLAAATLLAVIACNDNGLSPRSVANHADSLNAARAADDIRWGGGQPDFARVGSSSFDLSPSGGVINVGGVFTLNVPPNAVCDLSSSYGPAHWDEKCAISTEAIRVRARLWTKRGRIYVDFKPALRFSPDAEVTISTSWNAWTFAGRTDLAGLRRLRYFGILYSPEAGKGSIDEVSSLNDASLVTYVDLRTGRAWRRIKHFSGYNYAAGVECDPTSGDPDCVEVDVIPGR